MLHDFFSRKWKIQHLLALHWLTGMCLSQWICWRKSSLLPFFFFFPLEPVHPWPHGASQELAEVWAPPISDNISPGRDYISDFLLLLVIKSRILPSARVIMEISFGRNLWECFNPVIEEKPVGMFQSHYWLFFPSFVINSLCPGAGWISRDSWVGLWNKPCVHLGVPVPPLVTLPCLPKSDKAMEMSEWHMVTFS